MSDIENENIEFGWVRFTGEVGDPKLSWMLRQFDRKGIEHKSHGLGLKGKPIIHVKFEDIGDAHKVLNEEIGTLNIGEGHPITWSDLDDSHPLFTLDAVSSPETNPDPTEILGLEGEEMDFYGKVHVTTYEVSSSNVSRIGVTALQTDPPTWTLYSMFKGGAWYRYFPVLDSIWKDLCVEAVKASQGVQEASVGSLFHYAIKVAADEGQIKCHKLDAEKGEWYEVLPKSKRTASADKYKKKSGAKK